MASTYHLGATRRFVNKVMMPLSRRGLAGRHAYVLTVKGRKTGKDYSVPVVLIEDSQRWLVSPYGDVNWVRNVRAAGEVDLTRAGRTEHLRSEEVDAERAAPVLQRYLSSVPIVRPYFDVKPSSPIAEFVSEAPRHPVFELTSIG